MAMLTLYNNFIRRCVVHKTSESYELWSTITAFSSLQKLMSFEQKKVGLVCQFLEQITGQKVYMYNKLSAYIGTVRRYSIQLLVTLRKNRLSVFFYALMFYFLPLYVRRNGLFFLEFSKDSFLLNLKDVSVFSELIGSECENNIFVKFFGTFNKNIGYVCQFYKIPAYRL